MGTGFLCSPASRSDRAAPSGLRYAMVRRRLPIGMQTFRKLREQDCYYVDKTAYIERLLDEGTHYFLSRPRRFGKSLFLDTLKEFFEGNEELFAGLYIHQPPQLVGAPSGGAAELRRRQLQGARDSARGRGVPVGGPGGRGGHRAAGGRRAAALAPSAAGAASADGAAGGGAGGRVRQADPGRAGGEAGGGARQPRLPARAVRGDQGQRRARGIHVPDRHQQVLEGEPLFAIEQPHRPDAGSGLFVDLRVHRGRPGHGVRAGAGRAGPGAGAGVVQRLWLARRREGVQPVRRAAAAAPPKVRRALVSRRGRRRSWWTRCSSGGCPRWRWTRR